MSSEIQGEGMGEPISGGRGDSDRSRDKLVVLPNISWSQLERLDQLLTGTGARLTYLDGYLEIRTPTQSYEDLRSTLALLLETHLQESGRRFFARGGPPLGSEATQARKEPDESYDLDARKPVPDLVLEVLTEEIGIDKLEFYRRIQVPEVWIWRQKQLTLYRLRETGYEPIEYSELVPEVDPKVLEWYVNLTDQHDGVTPLVQQVRHPDGMQR